MQLHGTSTASLPLAMHDVLSPEVAKGQPMCQRGMNSPLYLLPNTVPSALLKPSSEPGTSSCCADCKSCSIAQDKIGGNASEGATATQVPAVPASTAANQLFISGMGPPARKTASLATILKGGALSNTRKEPVAHLQQPRSSLGGSRAGAQSAGVGASAAASDAADARAGQQQAASPTARQVISDTPPILPCMPPESAPSRDCVWDNGRVGQASPRQSSCMTAKLQGVGLPACCGASC